MDIATEPTAMDQDIDLGEALINKLLEEKRPENQPFIEFLQRMQRRSLQIARVETMRHESEQSEKAGILIQAWMFQNIHIEGSRKRNRRTLLRAMGRLGQLGVSVSDFQRATQVVSRRGYVGSYAFASAKEVAERLQYPSQWATFDTDILNILSHLLTDLVGCSSLQEILENDELGNFLVDGSMGRPSPELEIEKQVRAILATRPRNNLEKDKVNEDQQLKEEVGASGSGDESTLDNKIHSRETETSN